MAEIVRISEGTALGLHAMIVAARGGGAVTARSVALEVQGSEAHIAKVLRKLVRSGFLTSKRGPSGGYELAREAESTTLLEVYEALEGPLRADGCVFDRLRCTAPCILGTMVLTMRDTARRELSRMTLAAAAGSRRI
ncbi:MAG: Rrf2 family transcriptional regulator [Candidatus Bipolaricaulota bacterium]